MTTLAQRITSYLSGGGLFNSEMANHNAVRDLLIECRDALAAVPAAAPQAERVGWGGVIDRCAELRDPAFIAMEDLDELKRYAGNWNSTYRFFPVYRPDVAGLEAREAALEEAAELCEMWNTTPGRSLAQEIRELKNVSTKAVSAWQPIETAPRDGSIVMYWVTAVQYEGDEETGLVNDVDVSAPDFGRWTGGEDGYHEPFSGIPGDGGSPTHWQPLPAAPAA